MNRSCGDWISSFVIICYGYGLQELGGYLPVSVV